MGVAARAPIADALRHVVDGQMRRRYARGIAMEDLAMPSQISDEALDFLLARAGLDLTQAHKADLKSVYAGLADMAQRVRQPRGRMAEPAHIYDFSEEDLR
jgi:hypothetical protein